ncbi:hypothetical protein [Pandoraea pulmonicola]|uniref:Uncharacterized protein n=1 Tax=Pandoraea pulmonicola TaxID=93221 RepID=A0AAJ4ZDA0_PANPU|nr:hypothetical protein [Pandoraea pulmonicola]SUA91227.1 Uncharacterised protein [Pandoraea pulmonicola]
MIMVIPPNWFLYPDYVPPDKTRFCGGLSIASALEASRRMVTKPVQHGRIRKWLSRRYVGQYLTRN